MAVKVGLRINFQKTKIITIGKQREELMMRLDGEELEQVTEFLISRGIDGRRWQMYKRYKIQNR